MPFSTAFTQLSVDHGLGVTAAICSFVGTENFNIKDNSFVFLRKLCISIDLANKLRNGEIGSALLSNPMNVYRLPYPPRVFELLLELGPLCTSCVTAC